MKKARVDSSGIIAVGFSGQMMECLPVDRSGTPLRNSIIWMDERATLQADRIRRVFGERGYYEISGVPLMPTWPLKMMWLKEEEPEVFDKTYKFLQSNEFAVKMLTGEMLSDYSQASLTSALDVHR